MQEKEQNEVKKYPLEIITEDGTITTEPATEEQLLQVLQMIFGD